MGGLSDVEPVLYLEIRIQMVFPSSTESDMVTARERERAKARLKKLREYSIKVYFEFGKAHPDIIVDILPLKIYNFHMVCNCLTFSAFHILPNSNQCPSLLLLILSW